MQERRQPRNMSMTAEHHAGNAPHRDRGPNSQPGRRQRDLLRRPARAVGPITCELLASSMISSLARARRRLIASSRTISGTSTRLKIAHRPGPQQPEAQRHATLNTEQRHDQDQERPSASGCDKERSELRKPAPGRNDIPSPYRHRRHTSRAAG